VTSDWSLEETADAAGFFGSDGLVLTVGFFSELSHCGDLKRPSTLVCALPTHYSNDSTRAFHSSSFSIG
jgi:hypothetical protein